MAKKIQCAVPGCEYEHLSAVAASCGWVELQDGSWVCRNCSVRIVHDAWRMRPMWELLRRLLIYMHGRPWRMGMWRTFKTRVHQLNDFYCLECGAIQKEGTELQHKSSCFALRADHAHGAIIDLIDVEHLYGKFEAPRCQDVVDTPDDGLVDNRHFIEQISGPLAGVAVVDAELRERVLPLLDDVGPPGGPEAG